MTTYVITTSNWDSVSFWSSLDASSGGHTLDFSGLPSNFTVDYHEGVGDFYITDGSTTFHVAESGGPSGADAFLANGTLLSDFSTILGSQGGDIVIGGSGAESLGGNGGDDDIEGRGGGDTIAGGQGADTLDGGDDSDAFIIEDNFGNDTIIGGEGGTDGDTIDLSALTGPITVTYTGDEAGTITDGTDTISFSQIEALILTDQADLVDGSSDSAGLSIIAGDGANTVTGGSGDDSIAGGDDADSIIGGQGSDTLRGWDGDDTLEGGDGADAIYGGGGLDIVDYSNSDAAVTINLSTGSHSGGHAEGDTLAGVDGITGSDHNDFLTGFDGSGVDWTNIIDGGAGDDTIDGMGSDDTLVGGAGDDQITGGDGNDVFEYTPGDGSDTITDFNFGNTGALGDGDTTNNDFVDLSGYYDSLSELRADFDDDGVLNQSAGGDYSDNTQFSSGEGMTFSGTDRSSYRTDNTGVVCFAAGTMILTPGGEIPIELLRPGDLVVTQDNGPKPLLMAAYRTLRPPDFVKAPELKPILIQPGAFGQNRALIVSPQHGVLLQSEGSALFVRAKHLADLNGGAVRVMAGCRHVTYIHLLFEQHEVLFSNGIPTESYFPGPTAIQNLDPAARIDFNSLFPDLASNAKLENAKNRYGPTAHSYSRRHNLPEHIDDFRSIS